MNHFILLLAVAVFTIMNLSSCTGMKDGKPAPEDRKVNIRTRHLHDNKPRIEPPWVTLQYGTDQQVIWEIDNPDLNFTIKFKKAESPFDKKEFKNKDNKTGRAIVDPGEKEKFYYYSVEVDGFDSIDPGVIIWRKN